MSKTPGIYIHIPFCERKCTYCNFNTTDFLPNIAEAYVDSVSREICLWGKRLDCDNRTNRGGRITVDTIYFGGGTPSIIDADQLKKLIDACVDAFDVAADAEITIEVNPATVLEDSQLTELTFNKLHKWRAIGINRASIGVQSFIDEELLGLSRTHTARDAIETVRCMREVGFDNISLDLIAGLPEQSIAMWEASLTQALELRPEHLSLYLLEVKEGTQLFAQIKRGRRASPDDDAAAEMFRIICEATRRAGYEHYEISNFCLKKKHSTQRSTTGQTERAQFDELVSGTGCMDGPKARPSTLRSKHNLKYWTGTPFYGMGCGAHSYDGRARWVNLMKTETYIDSIWKSGHAIGERHQLSDEERAGEALFMGLRLTDGVDTCEFQREYGLDILAKYGDALRRLEDAGLVSIEPSRVWLTETGMLLSNEVFVEFV